MVQGDAPGGGGVMDLLGDAWSPTNEADEIYDDVDYKEIVGDDTTALDSVREVLQKTSQWTINGDELALTGSSGKGIVFRAVH